MSAGEQVGVLRRRVVGAVFISVIVLFLASTVAVYQKAFTPVVHVLLRTDRVGNQLQPPADVKVRGLVVGEVREVRATASGAELDLALHPDKVALIPAEVTARLLPKTLFGERYVSLVPPATPSPEPLRDDDVIEQDRSTASIELEEVLSDLMPVLRAVKPDKLASTLNTVSMALDGRGEQLGETLAETNRLLEQFNPALPELQANIRALGDVAHLYADTAPDLVGALRDLAVNHRTVAENRAGLERLYRTVTTGAGDLDGFLRANQNNIIELNAASREQLRLLARYSPEYPCLFEDLADAVPRFDQVAGKGTDTPGVVRLRVEISDDGDKYLPGHDEPRWEDRRGPRCYDQVPMPADLPGGGPPRDGSTHPPRREQHTPPASTSPSSATGPSGSIQHSTAERRLIAALLAPSTRLRPEEVPGWSSLLVGPLYRGAQVEVR
ncbi:MCE family protein [Saccharopolyspora rhizosphaerae]|uniref:MCE family protein n=1 Tax=Saccharopolyspora rhizosphaerae TaxID=2492662 RepID=A0A426JM70_9PSEU|nr:MCE family protein [Saccharopolyspora rhizosphaerae]RRO14175.1 MCE family protein [Saccharopolyspora rhizosphaerae]